MSKSGKMPTTCDICDFPFTKQLRKPVHCSKCNLVSCLQCNKTYLLGKKDLHCMGCKVGWTDAHASDYLGSFIHKDYRQHTTQLLWEMQKARMPETMPAVEREIKIRKMKEEEMKITVKMEEARKAWTNLQDMQRQIRHNIAHGIVDGSTKSDMEKKKKEFVRACPVNDCPGFLSSQWKCGVCETWTCKECMEVIGKDKQAEHVCNPDVLASAQLLKKETKPCPSCSAAIYKISGCDQMWCTQCKVAFSWRTGLKVTGVIHNPHFYEWQKQSGENRANPGAIACGGLPGAAQFNQILELLNLHQFYENDGKRKGNFFKAYSHTRQRTHLSNYIAQDEYIKYYRYNNTLRCIGIDTFLGKVNINRKEEDIQFPNMGIDIRLDRDGKKFHIPKEQLFIKFKLDYNNSDMKDAHLELKISNTILKIYKFCTELFNIHRGVNHFQHVELDAYRRRNNEVNNDLYQKKRVQYLMKELDENSFKRSLMMDDRKTKKRRAILDIFEVYNQVSNDCIREIYHKGCELHGNRDGSNDNNISDKLFNTIENQLTRLENVRRYSNLELLKISKVYKQVVPLIRKDGYIESMNYESWKKLYKEHGDKTFEVAYDILTSKTKYKEIEKINYDDIKQLKWSIPSIFTHKQKITNQQYEIYKNYLLSSRYASQRRRF
tara:strand:+ start:198 stop:2183 length:1986 start_codon:yes stop_codon:yes gene_type:complete